MVIKLPNLEHFPLHGAPRNDSTGGEKTCFVVARQRSVETLIQSFFYSCLLPTFFNVNSVSVVRNRWASDKRKWHPVFQSLFIFDPCKKGFMHRYEHTHPQIYREGTHLLNNLRHTELTPWVFYTNWSPMTIFLGQPCNLHSTFKLDCFILIFIHIFSWLLLIPLKKKKSQPSDTTFKRVCKFILWSIGTLVGLNVMPKNIGTTWWINQYFVSIDSVNQSTMLITTGGLKSLGLSQKLVWHIFCYPFHSLCRRAAAKKMQVLHHLGVKSP